MANIEIQIKNGDALIRAFRQAPDIMAKELQDAILQLGAFTVGEVKKTITAGAEMWKPPIKTGAMRRGIQIRQSGELKVIITPSDITPYALFVHEGTRFMKARPFFDITARHSQKDIEKFFIKSIDSAVSKIIKTSR